MLPVEFCFDNLTPIHYHFQNTTSTLIIARRNMTKRNIFKTFQDISSSENDLSDEDPEYQSSSSGDSRSKLRSSGIIRFRRITKPRALIKHLHTFWRAFFFSTIITNTENNVNKTYYLSFYGFLIHRALKS